MSHEINGILFCLTKNVCKKLSPKIHRIPWVLTEYVGQNMIYRKDSPAAFSSLSERVGKREVQDSLSSFSALLMESEIKRGILGLCNIEPLDPDGGGVAYN